MGYKYFSRNHKTHSCSPTGPLAAFLWCSLSCLGLRPSWKPRAALTVSVQLVQREKGKQTLLAQCIGSQGSSSRPVQNVLVQLVPSHQKGKPFVQNTGQSFWRLNPGLSCPGGQKTQNNTGQAGLFCAGMGPRKEEIRHARRGSSIPQTLGQLLEANFSCHI